MRLFLHLSGRQGLHRRLEDRIRELCAKLIAKPETPDWNEILRDLKTALRQHSRRMRALMLELPLRPERRSAE